MRTAISVAMETGESGLALVLSGAGGNAHRGLANLLQAAGFATEFVTDAQRLADGPAEVPALVVLDLEATPPDSVALLNRLSRAQPPPQVVLIGLSGQSDVGVVEFNQTVAFSWLTRAWHVDGLTELEQRLRDARPLPDIDRAMLVHALDRQEFVLHFQPIFDIRRGENELTAAESLIRWQHPRHGLLMPSTFLPVVERENLVAQLTDLTLQLAAEQKTAWKRAGSNVLITVNLDGELLTDLQFPARLMRYLAELGVEPDDLVLEVSEGGVMSRRPEPVSVAADLIDRGFRLVIDDFGRGPISLAQVLSLRFSGIKIDEHLIRQISRNERVRQLVRGMVRLAHDLGMRAGAKSVESAETLFFLKGLGCDDVQGWHLGRPVPGSQLGLG